jgi:hypothetical protein
MGQIVTVSDDAGGSVTVSNGGGGLIIMAPNCPSLSVADVVLLSPAILIIFTVLFSE